MLLFLLLTLGSSGVSVPIPRSYRKIKNDLVKEVEKGVYLLGDLIEPKTYQKLVLDKGGNIVKESFTVHARKIPLRDIRKKIFETHKKHGMNLKILRIFIFCYSYIMVCIIF